MSIFRVAADEYFWEKWKDRFMRNHEIYITPSEPSVKAAVRNADVCSDCDSDEKVDAVWEYVYENIDYKLTKEWQEPKETLKIGTGDCEDVSFLAASMLLASGVDKIKFAIGDMDTVDNGEKHTWLELDGRIIDPTIGVDQNGKTNYNPEEEFMLEVKHD